MALYDADRTDCNACIRAYELASQRLNDPTAGGWEADEFLMIFMGYQDHA